jgi:hypothetical protein
MERMKPKENCIMVYKPLEISCLMVLLILVQITAFCQSAQSKSRRWRVMVIVQEQHLQQPHIPDPAVETALCKNLIDAGHKVIDQDRYKDIRYSAVMDRILKGGPNTVKEAVQIGRRFGADILVTGEAFTEEVTRHVVETELGEVTRIQCRGRLELKAIRVDTAEKIYSDSLQKTGPPEDAVELSSKACLEDMGDDISDSLMKKLDKLSLGDTQQVELEIRGVKSVAISNELEKAISKVDGVLEIFPGDYNASTYQTEVNLRKVSLRDFAARLETTPNLKRFKMHVQSASGSRIVVNCK